MDAPGSAHDTRQERVSNAGPRGVGLPVTTHLGPRCRLEERVWLGMPELPVEADIDHVVAAEHSILQHNMPDDEDMDCEEARKKKLTHCPAAHPSCLFLGKARTAVTDRD